jgi:signal transduction histidine kinase
VTVQVSKEKKKAKIIVKDTGLGMSADAMKNLFSKFYRIKTDQTQKITGTGLGLWISRELARKMNGDLTAESMENVGSQFILTLPLDE